VAGRSARPDNGSSPAGQDVHWRYQAGGYPKDCAGTTIHITVAYVADSRLGLNRAGSIKFPPPGRGAIVVGRATVTVPDH
jgi:hypothetical protein